MTVFVSKHADDYEAKKRALDGRAGNGRQPQPFRRDMVDTIKAEGAHEYAQRKLDLYQEQLRKLRERMEAEVAGRVLATDDEVEEVKNAWHL